MEGVERHGTMTIRKRNKYKLNDNSKNINQTMSERERMHQLMAPWSPLFFWMENEKISSF
jgi:hypothetical protein